MPKHNLCLTAFSRYPDKHVNMLLPQNTREIFRPVTGALTLTAKKSNPFAERINYFLPQVKVRIH
jgi:hypothetical protein